MKKFGIFIVMTVMVASVFADTSSSTTIMTGLANVKDAMSQLCSGLTQMLPVVAMLMIILAGVIYAAGQMMGAETRARTNVWATAALIGALMAILIAVVAPPVLNAINTTGTPVQCT